MERTPGLDTQPAVAKAAGIAQSQVSRVLNCEIGCGLDILAAFADAFDCDPWELIVDEEETRRSILERVIRGSAVPDSIVGKHLPLPPNKVVAMRRRKR